VPNLRIHLKRALVGGLVGAVLVVGFIFNSKPYEMASSITSDPQIHEKVGDVRFHWLLSAHFSYREGQYSTFRFYLFGTKRNGFLTVVLLRRDNSFLVDAISLDGQKLVSRAESVGSSATDSVTFK